MGVIVETTKGQIEGVRRWVYWAFLGVPLANPPVGGLFKEERASYDGLVYS